jgi:hypothetical protein
LQCDEVQDGVTDETSDSRCRGQAPTVGPRLAPEELPATPLLVRERHDHEQRGDAESPGDQSRDRNTRTVGQLGEGGQRTKTESGEHDGASTDPVDANQPSSLDTGTPTSGHRDTPRVIVSQLPPRHNLNGSGRESGQLSCTAVSLVQRDRREDKGTCFAPRGRK